MNEYILDGSKIYDLNSFLSEIAKAVNAPNGYFGEDLLAFDDCLFGGFGLEAPCKIIWRDSNLSRQKLNTKMLTEYYEDQKKSWEEAILIEKEEYRRANTAIDGTLFSEDMLSLCNYKLESGKRGELDMFQDIVLIIQSVTTRATFDDSWIINLILE